MLFGLGSQNAREIIGHEVHSTLGSVLNNYGLIGLTLFGTVIFSWAKRIWNAHGFIGLICMVGPPMLYGITHNGTRFTFFWLLFAASLAMANVRLEQRDTIRSTKFPRAEVQSFPS